MKKILSFLLGVVLILGLGGCGNKKTDELTLTELEQYIAEEFKNEDSSIEEVKTAWNKTKAVGNAFGETTPSSEKQEYNDILKQAKEVEDIINSVNLKNVKNKIVREYCEEYMELAKKDITCIKEGCRAIIEGESDEEVIKYFDLAYDIEEYTEIRENIYNQYLKLSSDMTISELRIENKLDDNLDKITKSYNTIMGVSD